MPAQEISVQDAVIRIVVALLAGMLIGIEREKARAGSPSRAGTEEEEWAARGFPGLRSFSLIAVYAAVTGYLYSANIIDTLGFSVLTTLFLILVALFSAYRLIVMKSAGITTSIVMMVDFAVGLLAGMGYIIVAAAAAVLTTFILAIKIPVERVVGRISYEELLWALELLIVLLVLGPVVWGIETTFYGVSVRGLYLFFALVLVSSYIGYVVVRIKGGKGLAYLSFLGGFAHSEATLTGVLELLPREERRRIGHHVAVLANTAMLVRDLAIAALALYIGSGRPEAIHSLGLLVLGVLVSSIVAPSSWGRLVKAVAKIPVTAIGNPLRIPTAIKTSLVYIAISIASYTLREAYSSTALWLVAFAGGLVSSSATILAVYSGGAVYGDPLPALLAMAAGALNKPIYAYMASGDRKVVAKVFFASITQTLLLLSLTLPLTMFM